MVDDSELEKLIEEIARAQVQYEDLAFDEVGSHALGPPASEEAVRSLERRLGAGLPQDYRAFLRLHDGWDHFHGDGKLLAVADQDAGWVRKKLKFWTDIWDSEDPNPFARGAIPIMLGDSLHHFIVLDPTRPAPGEAAAIVEFDSMREHKVHAGFVAYLRSELSVLRSLIDRELHGLPEDDDDAPAGESV